MYYILQTLIIQLLSTTREKKESRDFNQAGYRDSYSHNGSRRGPGKYLLFGKHARVRVTITGVSRLGFKVTITGVRAFVVVVVGVAVVVVVVVVVVLITAYIYVSRVMWPAFSVCRNCCWHK